MGIILKYPDPMPADSDSDSTAGGGDLGNVDLIYIPEPTTLLLLTLGLLGLTAGGRRRVVTLNRTYAR